MLSTRYEEYVNFNENLPFVLSTGLTRTLTRRSSAANWHENVEIQICTEGSGFVLLDGEQIEIEQGDIVVVNTHVIHHTGTNNTLKYTCLIIDSQLFQQAGFDHTALWFEPHFKSEIMVQLFNRLEKTYFDRSDVCRIAKLRTTVLEMLIELRQNHTVNKQTYAASGKAFTTVKGAIKYIRENYKKRLTLDEIAKSVLVDKFLLSREFKKVTHQTVVEYINNYRCKKAMEHIINGTPVSEAARLCGFNNMSFFTKTFKQTIGKLPSEYKNKEQV